MPRIIRTPQANDDIFGIWEYITERNASAANSLIRRIDETLKLLAESPGIGQRQDHYRVGLRCFPIDVYLIFYLALADGIEVVRILHGARDIPAVFEDRGDPG